MKAPTPKKTKAKAKPKVCNLQQLAFIREVLSDEDMNASQAYARVYKVSLKVAHANSARLMAEPHIKAALKLAMAEREKRTGIKQDAVLSRLWAIATADANALMQVRRVNCRYCHGTEHHYQWKNQAEFESACAKELADARGDKREAHLPGNDGGYGYDPTELPHPECPNCYGEGHIDVHIEDTRYLTGAGKHLYAGVKQTQFGIEIKTRDQDAALMAVGRHLGMFNDKLTLLGDKENPIAMLVAQLSGATLTPGTKED